MRYIDVASVSQIKRSFEEAVIQKHKKYLFFKKKKITAKSEFFFYLLFSDSDLVNP